MKIILAAMLACCFSMSAMAASVTVTQNQFKDKWPLTVLAGTLHCEPLPSNPKLSLVTFSSGGKTYALNGIASGRAKSHGWADIYTIWKDDPTNPPAKLNIGPLTDRGLALCK